jgi:protein-arginine kinase activator protein McsA
MMCRMARWQTGQNSFALSISVLSRQMLEDALQHAVEHENYEVASQLRDELAKRTPATPDNPQ